ncbi:MAG TPA: phage major capsid protein [Dehalococcoidia bacterium]|nr:phage major capsid protein [Dehalococcoidia bacterium]
MALTLAEAAKLSNDVVLQGVIETVVKESHVLDLLPFVDMVGNALTYNRENAMATAAFFDVGDTWTESTPTFTQVQTTLKILGGDADVDRYIATTRSNVQDIEAAVLELKAKAVAHEFEDEFVYGDTAVDAKGFDGLHKLIGAGAQQVNMGSGSTPAALSVAKLDELIDLLKPGKPDFLMMSRRTRRGLGVFARALTSPVTYEPDEFGRRVAYFDGIPIVVSDFMVDTETIASGRFSAKTGGASTSIFAVKVGEGQLSGLTNGGIQIDNIGELETKDARRWRCKWYVAIALFSALAIARLDGVSSAAVVA